MLAGSGATFTQNGAGTTTLSVSNTYTGGTTLNAGQLAIGNAAAFGTGAVTFASNASVAALTALTITNNYSVSSSATATFNNDGATNLTNSGIISGGGAIAKTGTGTLTLSGANTFGGAGVTNVVRGGQLTLAVATALGNSANSLDVQGGSLNNSFSVSAGSVALGNASIVGSGTITGTSYTATNTGAASIANTLAGAGGFTQSGTGTTTFTAANTFTGTTAITAGGVALAAGSSFASTNIYLGTLASQGTFDVTAKGSSYALTASQTLSGYGTVTNGVSNTLTISGAITPGNLATTNTGTINVTGHATLGSASTTTLQIYSATSTNFDKLIVAGTLTYGGTLNLYINTNVYNFSDMTIGTTSTYQLFTSTANTYTVGLTNVALIGSWTGSFTNNTGGNWKYTDSSNNLAWTMNELNGQLVVTSIPEPSDLIYFAGLITAAVLIYRRRKQRQS